MSTHENLGDHRSTKPSGVPLETIAELIESEVGAVQRESGDVFFDGTIGTTRIRVTPVDVDTVDGGRAARLARGPRNNLLGTLTVAAALRGATVWTSSHN